MSVANSQGNAGISSGGVFFAARRKVFELQLLSLEGAALVTLMAVVASAFLIPLFLAYDPSDLSKINLMDAFTPPVWLGGGNWSLPFGADDQGRDLLAMIVHGTRTSLIIATLAVSLSMVLGVTAGLAASYYRGWLEIVILRLADVQLSFPPLLIALVIDGVLHGIIKDRDSALLSGTVVVAAIALSGWVQYARSVRASALVELQGEYVVASLISGCSVARCLFLHVLPNVFSSILVLGSIQIASAIIIEATLSFLGVGLPVTKPSLGTLIRVGNNFLLSGQWWVSVLPGLVLVLIVLCCNLVGDWLQDRIARK
ncbi:peptide/nickel transport system permease protein [Bosea sp. AK1]|uniref:ABC transporter permease n=1 Tax=Bosea sp. AK1 TaxID=2587160 RepID=UPI001151AB89|nr:ABC transporter permease [Bosea sp. AK1]TQI65281.1 peptide/nickel transport system permease protein [Bosea sp. AK1]